MSVETTRFPDFEPLGATMFTATLLTIAVVAVLSSITMCEIINKKSTKNHLSSSDMLFGAYLFMIVQAFGVFFTLIFAQNSMNIEGESPLSSAMSGAVTAGVLAIAMGFGTYISVTRREVGAPK